MRGERGGERREGGVGGEEGMQGTGRKGATRDTEDFNTPTLTRNNLEWKVLGPSFQLVVFA